MEDTCAKNECPMWKKFKEKCPNYIESWWTPSQPGGDGQPILLHDCAPRRTFLMIQELNNRLIGVEKSNEQQRNTNIVMLKTISDMVVSNAKHIGNQDALDIPFIEIIEQPKETGDD